MADDETIARLTQERDEAEAALLEAVNQWVALLEEWCEIHDIRYQKSKAMKDVERQMKDHRTTIARARQRAGKEE